jgi:hypothetical protein
VTLVAGADALPDVRAFTQTLNCTTSPACTAPGSPNDLVNTASVAWATNAAGTTTTSADAAATVGPIECACSAPAGNVTGAGSFTRTWTWCAPQRRL